MSWAMNHPIKCKFIDMLQIHIPVKVPIIKSADISYDVINHQFHLEKVNIFYSNKVKTFQTHKGCNYSVELVYMIPV